VASYLDDITAARSNVLQRLDAGEVVSPEERETLDQMSAGRQGEFRKGLRRAAYNASATSRAFLGGVTEPFAPDFAEDQFARAERIARSQPADVAPAIDSFRKVNNLQDAVKYASGALGEGMTSVGSIVAGSLAARLGLGGAALAAGTRASQGALRAAQYTGGAAAMLPQEGGETALTLRQNPEAMANTTALERAGLTLGKGAIAGAMESIVPNLVFTNAVTGAAGRIAAGARPGLANVGRKAAGGALGEFATEGAQELSGQVAENLATGRTEYDFGQALEAAVRGSITGGVLGGAGGTVQAVRSNIDAAAERVQEEAPGALNAAVERLDEIIRNPEEFGADLTNATLGGLAELSERARAASEAAGPAAARGMDVISGAKRQLDRSMSGKLTPENRKLYAEMTANMRLLSPNEYNILRTALETGDSKEINKAVGAVSKMFFTRVPRETIQGVKTLAGWAKKFGRGVTKAARDRKASMDRYTPAQIQGFADYLKEFYPEVANTLIDSQEKRGEVMRALMGATRSKLSPKDFDLLQSVFSTVDVDIGTFLKDISTSRSRTTSRPRQTVATLSEAEELEAAEGSGNMGRISSNFDFLTPEIQEYLEAEDIEVGPGATNVADPSVEPDSVATPTPVALGSMADQLQQVYDPDGSGRIIDEEDPRNTPFTSLDLAQRIVSATSVYGKKNEYKPEFNVPVTFEPAIEEDEQGNPIPARITPEQIARILGSSDVISEDETVQRDITDEELTERITEDGKVQTYISPVALAANTGKEEVKGGYKEAFAKFVPDFEGTNRDIGVQGYRFLSALATLNDRGIELAPDQIPQSMWEELGITEDSAPIKIKVNIGVNSIDPRTVIQRKYIGNKRRDVTLGDLLGVTRSKRKLEAQLGLLENMSGYKEIENISHSLNKLVDRVYVEGSEVAEQQLINAMQDEDTGIDMTADAALRGLKKFAKDNKLSPNAAVPGYMEQLEQRIVDSDRRGRFSNAMNGLKTAYKEGFITAEQVEDLRAFKAGEYVLDQKIDSERQAADNLNELANFLQSDMDVAWRTDEELAEMLEEFADGPMWEVDRGEDEFADNLAGAEPRPLTADEEFDAAMKYQQGSTRSQQVGMDKQLDAAARRSTPMTVAHQRKVAEALPTTVKAIIDEQAPFLYDPSVQQLEFDLPVPLTYDGREFIDVRHLAESYELKEVLDPSIVDDDGEPIGVTKFEKAPEDTFGMFNQKRYDRYIAQHAARQEELAERVNRPRPEPTAIPPVLEREQLAKLQAQARRTEPRNESREQRKRRLASQRRREQLEEQRTGEYPVVLAEGIRQIPAGITRKLYNDLLAAQTIPEVEAVRDAATRDIPPNSERAANINEVVDRRRESLGLEYDPAREEFEAELEAEYQRLFGEEDVVEPEQEEAVVDENAVQAERRETLTQRNQELREQLAATPVQQAARSVVRERREQALRQRNQELREQLDNLPPAQEPQSQQAARDEGQQLADIIRGERTGDIPRSPERPTLIIDDQREGESNEEFLTRKLGELDNLPPAQEPPTNEQPPEPPQEPPAEPPGGEPPPPPPPPPDEGAQQQFIDNVEQLLGKGRVGFEFNSENLAEGLAGEYVSRFGKDLEDTGVALAAIYEKRRSELDALKDENDPRSEAEIRDSIATLEQLEQDYLNDAAIRGTIRVAAGMESQAGLGEHEAFHAAFSIFFGEDNAAERRVLATAFSKGLLGRQLRDYYRGNDEVMAVIDPNSKDFRVEEAAAYGFQTFLHDPGALKMGEQVEGIFNRFLKFLQGLVGYKTYDERARMIMNDLASGRRAERGTSALRDMPHVERSMLDRSQEFVRNAGTSLMHLYDAVLTSAYSRLDNSGNPALSQIARLGYNATGQEGHGMIQRMRRKTTQLSNTFKEALHTLTEEEMTQLGRAMMLNEELDPNSRMGKAQQRLRTMLEEVYQYQVDAGVDIGYKENYYPMIWDPDKVRDDKQGFIDLLRKPEYAAKVAEMRKTPDEIWDSIVAFEERGHDFQGIFGKDGEPIADSSRRRVFDFIAPEDRAKYMEDDLIETMAHYLNQSVRHAEYVRAYGNNSEHLKRLLSEVTNAYGGTKADVDLAKDYIDGLMGNKEIGMSRELKDLYGAATVYQNVRLLPLNVFSSLVDPLGIAVRTGDMKAAWETFAYSMRNMFTDFRNQNTWERDDWETFAERMGTIDMSGTVKSIDKIYTGVTLRGKTRAINDGFFKWNLLNGWVKNNHIMATKAAQLFLRHSAENTVSENDKKRQRAFDDLQEVGVNPEDIVYDEELGRIRATVPELLGVDNMDQAREQFNETELQEASEQADRIQEAIHNIVRQSLIQPSSAEMPGWMSNPYLAPIAHLKTFVFGFNATILKRLMYEAQRGNYNPIMYAATYVPGMIAADFIKGFAGNGGEEPDWKKNWGLGDYVGYGVQRSGLTGTAQFLADMNNDVTRGGGGFETLAGPSIEQATDLMRALSAKTSQPTATWMLNALPANTLYDQWFRKY
jgi:hypothetical protein